MCQIAALCIKQFALGQAMLQCLLDGGIALRGIGYAPGACNVCTVISQRTDEGDGIIGVEWQ